MIKIAIPTKGNTVDDHFGHCEKYTIFTVNENKQITNTKIMPSPQGCGCKNNIGALLKEQGVSVLLAGNMGIGALNVLHQYDIEVFRGCTGEVDRVASMFIEGLISDSGLGCSNHEHHHGHNQ